MKYDVLVIGSGPGGYVAAIRASQLGLKTGVVERESLGGICLNWGCIPTKSLLKSAQVLDYFKHAEDYGIKIEGEVKPEFDKIVARSRGVAEGMSNGIQYLFKKNKIDVISGTGKLKSKGVVTVTDDDGKSPMWKQVISFSPQEHAPRELPNLKQDGKKIIGYRKAMTLDTSRINGSGWFRSHWK